MPGTRARSAVLLSAKPKASTVAKKLIQNTEEKEETAYERIFRKVEEKRRAEGKTMLNEKTPVKKAKTTSKAVKPKSASKKKGNAKLTESNAVQVASAQFIEDDNFVEMGLMEEQRKEFTTPSEEENESDESDVEMEQPKSQNNNVTVTASSSRPLGAQRSTSPRGDAAAQLPDRSDEEPMDQCLGDEDSSKNTTDQDETFSLIQSYMLKKGIIQKEMRGDELNRFLREEMKQKGDDTNESSGAVAKKTMAIPKNNERGKTLVINTATSKLQRVGDVNESASEITIY